MLHGFTARASAALLAALTLAGGAHGATVPINNADFENPDAGTGFLVSDPTGWVGVGRVVLQSEASANMPADASGDQWLILDARTDIDGQPGEVYQNVGTVAGNTVYDFSVLIGARPSPAPQLPSNYVFGLYADADDNGTPETLLASANKAAFTPTAATPITGSVQFDTVGSTLLGKDLYVRMLIPGAAASNSPTQQVLFDDAALEATAYAPADPVVVNGSFEQPATGSFTTTGPTGWTDEGDDGRSVVQNDSSTGMPGAIDGDQWLILDARATPGAVHQNVGFIDEGRIYQLELTVGQRSNLDLPDTFEFGLYADLETMPGSPDTPLIVLTQDDVTLPTAGTAGTDTLQLLWDSTGSGLDGYSLFVRMAVTSTYSGSGTRQVLFDAVSVTALVPEPSSMAALVGLGALLSVRRRRDTTERIASRA